MSFLNIKELTNLSQTCSFLRNRLDDWCAKIWKQAVRNSGLGYDEEYITCAKNLLSYDLYEYTTYVAKLSAILQCKTNYLIQNKQILLISFLKLDKPLTQYTYEIALMHNNRFEGVFSTNITGRIYMLQSGPYLEGGSGGTCPGRHNQGAQIFIFVK